MREIIIATKNNGKAKEFASLFGVYGINVKSLLDFHTDLPDIEETGSTFEENAKLKAEGISQILGKIVIADDSGLVVPALNGRPGVHSARFAGEPKSDFRNNEKLLAELNKTASSDRSAYFTCVLALTIPNEDTIFASGTCNGHIAATPKGENGFGYDPLFIPEHYQQTMAEIDSQIKNKISHRYHALKQLELILKQKSLIG